MGAEKNTSSAAISIFVRATLRSTTRADANPRDGFIQHRRKYFSTRRYCKKYEAWRVAAYYARFNRSDGTCLRFRCHLSHWSLARTESTPTPRLPCRFCSLGVKDEVDISLNRCPELTSGPRGRWSRGGRSPSGRIPRRRPAWWRLPP